MYLKTVFELHEAGIAPMRARIAERLGHSGPTVSQTVARMERDGLLHLDRSEERRVGKEGRARGRRERYEERGYEQGETRRVNAAERAGDSFVSAVRTRLFFFFSSRRRHTRWPRDWSSDVCSSDLCSSSTKPGSRR